MNGEQTYIAAQVKVLKLAQEVDELAKAGNHKKKNKIIHEQLRKACIARNKALRNIAVYLDTMAEEIAQGL